MYKFVLGFGDDSKGIDICTQPFNVFKTNKELNMIPGVIQILIVVVIIAVIVTPVAIDLYNKRKNKK